MADKEDPKLLEDDPLAEADAVECEAPAPDAEYTAPERDGAAHEAEASMREQIFETFQPRTDVMVPSPLDGLPVPRDETTDLATAHPFTYETMTCIEDDREYVDLFDDELSTRGYWETMVGDTTAWVPHGDRDKVTANCIQLRPRYDRDGNDAERQRFTPEQVERRWGVALVRAPTGIPGVEDSEPQLWVPVRPIRERCIHYKRQIMANDDAPHPEAVGHFLIFRNCTKRRSVGGAFMTLRDEAMYACDHREPYERAPVEKHLDERDRKALASKRHLEMVRAFNLSG